MEEVVRALSPVLEGVGLELVEVESGPGLVRVIVDRPGGVDLDGLAEANRLASRVLDELDPLPSHYTLEVTSPGLERPLRRPEHFVRAIGSSVSVRTRQAVGEARRLTGTLVDADDERFVLEGAEVPDGRCELAYDDVDRARTVFTWGANDEPRRRGKRSPSVGATAGKPTGETTTAGKPTGGKRTGGKRSGGNGHPAPAPAHGAEVNTP